MNANDDRFSTVTQRMLLLAICTLSTCRYMLCDSSYTVKCTCTCNELHMCRDWYFVTLGNHNDKIHLLKCNCDCGGRFFRKAAEAQRHEQEEEARLKTTAMQVHLAQKLTCRIIALISDTYSRKSTRRILREQNRWFRHFWLDLCEKMRRMRNYENPFLMETVREIEGVQVIPYFEITVITWASPSLFVRSIRVWHHVVLPLPPLVGLLQRRHWLLLALPGRHPHCCPVRLPQH